MSVRTPILAVLSCAKAGAANPKLAQAMSAAVCRANSLFMDVPPNINAPGKLSCGAWPAVDRTVWLSDSTSGAGRQCAYRSVSRVIRTDAQHFGSHRCLPRTDGDGPGLLVSIQRS